MKTKNKYQRSRKLLCSLILFCVVLSPVWVQATLVKGTNCGFVTVSPEDDPVGSISATDYKARAAKDVAPVTGTVTEIGWWIGNATEEANFEVAIYSHDAGNNRPNAIIGSDKTNAKGTGLGWKKVTGLSIPITNGTTYWIAFQLDDTETISYTDYASLSGERVSTTNDVSTFPDPWTASGVANIYLAIYAVYEEGAPPEEGQVIIISDASDFHRPPRAHLKWREQ